MTIWQVQKNLWIDLSLKKLQKEPCRNRDLTDNEKESFSTYSHIQRYYPALDIFTIPDSVLSKKNIELPSRYVIEHWNLREQLEDQAEWDFDEEEIEGEMSDEDILEGLDKILADYEKLSDEQKMQFKKEIGNE